MVRDAARVRVDVGGIVSGAEIDRGAAGCGFAVPLVEQHVFAALILLASTRLIHAGLRYLKESGLLKKALLEREALLATAPHVVRPVRFVMLDCRAWPTRPELFLFGRLARRPMLPGSTSIHIQAHPVGVPQVSSLLKVSISAANQR